jgi:hypothetical protein
MFGRLFQSNGVKRTLSVIFFLIGEAATVVPVLLPYQGIIQSVATVLGVTGIGHAAVNSQVK